MLADGRTAMMLMDTAGPMTGTRVLVEAAAGGVGTLLAKSGGAKVLAAAGARDKLALVRELGADVMADYSNPRLDGGGS